MWPPVSPDSPLDVRRSQHLHPGHRRRNVAAEPADGLDHDATHLLAAAVPVAFAKPRAARTARRRSACAPRRAPRCDRTPCAGRARSRSGAAARRRSPPCDAPATRPSRAACWSARCDGAGPRPGRAVKFGSSERRRFTLTVIPAIGTRAHLRGPSLVGRLAEQPQRGDRIGVGDDVRRARSARRRPAPRLPPG